MPATITLTGTVIDQATEQGVSSVEVQIWPTQQGSTSPLTTAVTDATGQFVVQLALESSGLAQSIQFKILQDGRRLELAEDSIKWGGRAPNRTVTIPVLVDAAAKAENWLNGTLCHTDNTAVSGLTIRAFHRQLGSEVALGETKSDADGSFEMSYASPEGVSSVNLFVRALDSEERILATSDVRVGVSDQEDFTLKVSDNRFRGRSAFQWLSEELPAVMGDADPLGFTADDVALLVRKTGLPIAPVTAWIASLRLSKRSNVSHEALYALVRVENTGSLRCLLDLNESRVRAVLSRAADENLVSQSIAAKADDIVSQLKGAKVDLHASTDTPGSLGQVLAISGKTSADQQKEFIRRRFEHTGPIKEFWTELRNDKAFGEEVVNDLQLSLQIGGFTQNHPPLAKALRARMKQTQRRKQVRATGISTKSLASTVVSLSKNDWKTLINSEVDGQVVGVPDTIAGATEAEQVDNYATLLKERAVLAFPTAAVANVVPTTSGWEQSNVASFISANSYFDLKTMNVSKYLTSDSAKIDASWDTSKLKTDLLAVQRVMRISPETVVDSASSALLGSGFTSALAVTRKSRATFVATTGTALGDNDVAKEVYRNAQFQVCRSLGAYMLMHPALTGRAVRSLATISDDVSTNPTWTSLFGSTDYCTCDECGSIFGPAAYLVDLLGWLDARDAFDPFDKRRPDIKNIKLTCDNTNIALPYTDLVNEILEARVLALQGGSFETNVPTGSTGTSEELLANPEYLQTKVYDEQLSKAVFPHSLPFDLWTELARVYFQHLGVARYVLMETLQRANQPSVEAIATERLQLSPTLWAILDNADGHEVWEHWGYDSNVYNTAAFTEDLAVVSRFLERSGLDYSQLLDLLHTRFANPNGLQITGSACNTDERVITDLGEDECDRMHRFLRLWRSCGWTMLEVDKAIFATNPPGVGNKDLLLQEGRLLDFADLNRVRELSKASLLDALSWWSPMDTFSDRDDLDDPVLSLYEKVFLNRSVHALAGDTSFPFALDAEHTELSRIDIDWDDAVFVSAASGSADINVRSALQAALRISAEDLALLIDAEIDGSANVDRVVTIETVSLSGLSALYRHVTCVRALGVTLSEFFGLRDLIAIEPFDLNQTSATVDFFEAIADIRASGFSFDELHYLLEHDEDAETRVGVTDGAIGVALAELADGLKKIDSELVETTDPTGELTERYLTMLLAADAVTAVMVPLGDTSVDPSDVLKAQLVPSLETLDVSAIAAFTTTEERYAALQKQLIPYLRNKQQEALAIQTVATFIGRDLDSAEDLLKKRVVMTLGGAETTALDGLTNAASPFRSAPGLENGELVLEEDPEAFFAFRRLFKIALALARMAVDTDEQKWLFETGVDHGLFDLTSLPTRAQQIASGAWDSWTTLVDLFALRDGLPGGEPTLVEVLELLDTTAAHAPSGDEFKSELAARTGWLSEDIQSLATAFNFAFPDDWYDGAALWKLVDALSLIQRLEAPVDQALDWVNKDLTAQHAEEIRLVTKAKYDEAAWPAIARDLRDPVRDKQRAALVAFVIAQEDDIEDEEDLYGDLLIDVEMGSCMLTSRIKQAIASTQLFIDRAFLNLEEGITLSRGDRDQWEWMQTYRVWEANRKVFLYAENWIYPDLRTTKTPFFEILESTLLQGEITQESVESAYLDYLQNLANVSRLEVMGMYHQYEEPDDDGTVDILHVIARTRSDPHTYWYRQWVDAREWTAWDKLDFDIDADHVILAVHDRRFMAFWPVFTKGATTTGTNTEDQGVEESWQIRLAWSERANEQWSSKRISEDYLSTATSSTIVRTKKGPIEGRATRVPVGEDGSHVSFPDYESSDSNSGGGGSGTGGGVSGSVSSTFYRSESHFFFRLADADSLKIECLYGSSAQSADRIGTYAVDSCSGMVEVSTDSEEDLELVAPARALTQYMRFKMWANYRKEETYAAFDIMSGDLDEKGEHLEGDAEELEVLKQMKGSTSSYAYPHQYGDFASQHGVFLDDDEQTFFVMPDRQVDLSMWFQTDLTDPTIYANLPSKSVETKSTKTTYKSDLNWQTGVSNVDLTGKRVGSARDATKTNALMRAAETSGQQASNITSKALSESDSVLRESVAIDGSFATTTSYLLTLFQHPYVCEFIKAVRKLGVEGLLDPNPDTAGQLVRQALESEADWFDSYEPTDYVLEPYPGLTVDFEYGGPYSDYNWELFFHIPFFIAIKLYQDRQFEASRTWFHYIFDPTNRTDESDDLRFWKIKPFYREPDAPISDFLKLVASDLTTVEAMEARAAYDAQVEAWIDSPFDTDAIARLRTTVYQKAIVMKYLDNLIAWADDEFRQDTTETINQATQLYVLAYELLGKRPVEVPTLSEPGATTFAVLHDNLSNAVLNDPLVTLENELAAATAFSESVPSTTGANTWQTFQFCISENSNLEAYWDVVEDRLFKIRNCMNIEGVVRELPLFDPPIDPGMLVRARASGVDLASALSDLNAPLPHYRFAVMLQKAQALNQTVRGLGAALLSALEKKDAEGLANLRASQEVSVLEAITEVKQKTIEEAEASLKAAEKAMDLVTERKTYYDGLKSKGWLDDETKQVNRIKTASGLQTAASGAALVGMAVTPIPKISVETSLSPAIITDIIDGQKLGYAMQLVGQSLSLLSAVESSSATVHGITAGYARREEDWVQQITLAEKELDQLEKQKEAAIIRVALAEKDLAAHEKQVENAKAVQDFMEEKYTNEALYGWMIGQISTLYFQGYQLAYDLAKRAEQAYRHELALPEGSFIQYGYWDSLKKGLLAGDRLEYDLQRMDAAYLENNSREYEITKHISLALLNPDTLLRLRTEGTGDFGIPEALFDLDYLGHYMRRIKSVSLTLPCVAGPQTSIPCKLTLLSSRVRHDATATSPYAEQTDDTRFWYYRGAVESFVTSGARDDGGLFVQDHRDERYLPFEGAGAISSWRLQLTSAVQTFDWSTITDVVLTVRYTAREGGDKLKTAVRAELGAALNTVLAGRPLVRAFSAKREFPNDWHAFLYPPDGASETKLVADLSASRFPYFAQQSGPKITNLQLVALRKKDATVNALQLTIVPAGDTDPLSLSPSGDTYSGNPTGSVSYSSVSPSEWSFALSLTSIPAPSEWLDDLIILASYEVTL